MAKYNADQLKALGDKGQAMKNANGEWSYPIGDQEDLDNAIHAVGRGGSDHDAIRKYVIGVAKKLGLSDHIPDNWNADGSLKTSDSADLDAETRDKPTPEDQDVTAGLAAAKVALAKVKACQLQDPDNGTDPDDEAVMAAINAAEAAVDQAIAAQSKDGHDDKKEKKSAIPAVPKRAFPTLTERPLPVARIEVRMDGDSDPNAAQFIGYASTTGTAYSVRDWLGEYEETIQPGAFAKTLREQIDVPLLFNHDGFPLASTASGTSRLSEDAHGLRNEAVLDRADGNTNTVCVQLRRGVLNKMSFSFRAIKDTWNDAYDQRAVNELALYDTSIVTYPANPLTSGELRSMFVDAIGREGQGVMWSLRSAMGDVEQRGVPDEAEPVLEQAIRALAHADEIMCRRAEGPHVRARTFLVAGLMEQVRKGAVLSSKNKQLLQSAVDALAGAQKQHAKVAANHQKAMEAMAGVMQPGSGIDGDQGGGNGAGPGKNPLSPIDGAGPRHRPRLDHAKRVADKLRNPA